VAPALVAQALEQMELVEPAPEAQAQEQVAQQVAQQ